MLVCAWRLSESKGKGGGVYEGKGKGGRVYEGKLFKKMEKNIEEKMKIKKRKFLQETQVGEGREEFDDSSKQFRNKMMHS